MVVDSPDGAILSVKVLPRAGRDEVAGVRQGALLIRLAAAPVEGAANVVLVRLLANVFDVPRRAIAIVSGVRSREKKIRVTGASAADLSRKLAAWLPQAD